jgi:hypothetical protein
VRVDICTELFGWTAGPEFDGYTLIDTGAGEGAVGGGIGLSYGEGDTGVKHRGDSPHVAARGLRTFAVVSDVGGNPVGLWAWPPGAA